ncbi:MAG: phospholipase D-like domain-containing protein, partial [Haloferacaceae archaeon]
ALLVSALLVGGLAPAVGATPGATSGNASTSPTPSTPSKTASTAPEHGRILEAYPNPHARGDPGEYVVVAIPRPGNWTLSDGTTTVALPNRTGTFAASSDPDVAATRTDRPVYGLEGRFRLANDGETLTLCENGTGVDSVEYGRAPAGSRWLRDAGELFRDPDADGGWRADGFRPREPTTVENASGRAFVLPDSPGEPLTPIRTADERVLLAAYTLESWRLAEALVAARDRGATVRVLLEGAPVGGATKSQAAVLDLLDRQGVEIRVLDGERARYSYHHAKYAVADGSVVVLTENWKPSGTGGAGNRGWGVRVRDREVAATATSVFEHDAGWRDAVPWRRYRANASFRDGGTANGSYPARFPPRPFDDATVRLLVAPDNAESELASMIDDADERVAVVVPRTGGTEYRLVEAALGAAKRGATVRLLLSGTWYDREENEAFATEIRERGPLRGDLAVRIVEPRGRYGKLHAKGAVIDDTAVVGSLNWNDHSASRNRELLVSVEDPAVAAFYWRVAAADWYGGSWRTPAGLVGGFLAVSLSAGAIARKRVRFA